MSPRCHCCQTIHQYIQDHLDPHGYLGFKDFNFAKDIVANLNHAFREEGGSGVTVAQMRAYLWSLKP